MNTHRNGNGRLLGSSVCPECKHTEVDGASVDVHEHSATQQCTCLACGACWIADYALDAQTITTAGYGVWHHTGTGGGCTALQCNNENGTYWLYTHELSAPDSSTAKGTQCALSLYSENDTFVIGFTVPWNLGPIQQDVYLPDTLPPHGQQIVERYRLPDVDRLQAAHSTVDTHTSTLTAVELDSYTEKRYEADCPFCSRYTQVHAVGHVQELQNYHVGCSHYTGIDHEHKGRGAGAVFVDGDAGIDVTRNTRNTEVE